MWCGIGRSILRDYLTQQWERWAFLFTCMTTRAVHIKTDPSLNTGFCVMGIERFIARCRTPCLVCLDNRTAFAEKELMLWAESWNRQAPSLVVHEGVEWKYTPPGAPHRDASWESLVSSCKCVFYAVIGTRKLTGELLYTINAYRTFLVDHLLNARPLTPVSPDSTELKALTPNLFLLGEHFVSFLSLTLDDSYRKRYVRAQI